MPLMHRTIKSNEVRAPVVPRGEAIVVDRYRENNPKVALVNPEDLKMLEDAHDMLQALGQLGPTPLDDLAITTLELEDRPSRRGAIEDADEIAKLLDL
jgi:hypothetical protein